MKLILTDIDGTLLSSKGVVTQRTLDAIKSVKEKGHLFGVASGRNAHDLIRNFPKELSDALDVVVGENGYRINDFLDDTEILGTLMPQSSIGKCMDLFKGLDYSVVAIDETGITCAEETKVLDDWIEEMKGIKNYHHVSDEDFKKMPISKLSFFVYPSDSEEAVERMKAMNIDEVIGMQTTSVCFEFQHVTTCKSNGIKKFISKHNIPVEDVIVLGDGENDVDMIEYAGLGIAMKNAHPRVKAVADIVSEYTNDEEAVAYHLENI